MGLLAPSADCPCHLRCVRAHAAKPVSALGRSQKLLGQPPLSRARLDTAPLDVDHAHGPLHSSDVDDPRPGLPALGHEPPRLPSDRSPPARRECGGLLLHSPTAPGTGSARSLGTRSEEHTSELQSPCNLVCRLLLEKKKKL